MSCHATLHHLCLLLWIPVLRWKNNKDDIRCIKVQTNWSRERLEQLPFPAWVSWLKTLKLHRYEWDLVWASSNTQKSTFLAKDKKVVGCFIGYLHCVCCVNISKTEICSWWLYWWISQCLVTSAVAILSTFCDFFPGCSNIADFWPGSRIFLEMYI